MWSLELRTLKTKRFLLFVPQYVRTQAQTCWQSSSDLGAFPSSLPENETRKHLKSSDRWEKNNNKNEKNIKIKAAEMWSLSELTTSGRGEVILWRAKWWSQPFRDFGKGKWPIRRRGAVIALPVSESHGGEGRKWEALMGRCWEIVAVTGQETKLVQAGWAQRELLTSHTENRCSPRWKHNSTE